MSLAFCSFFTKIAPSTSVLRLPPRASFFKDVPRVLLVFVKNKQNAQDIRQKRGKRGKHRNFNGYVKTSKTLETSSKNLLFCGAPERPPRCPQEAFKRHPRREASKRPPRGLQEASKRVPGGPAGPLATPLDFLDKAGGWSGVWAPSHPPRFSRKNNGVVRGARKSTGPRKASKASRRWRSFT